MSRIDEVIAELCPRGVAFKPLGAVGSFIRGNGLQKKDLADEGVGAIHYGQVFTIYGTYTRRTRSFASPANAQHLRKAVPGSLIVATTSENDEDVCKAVAWLGDGDIVISGDAYIYAHSLDPLYVAYFFQTSAFQSQKRRFITGTKVKRVSGTDLAKIMIPVSPPEVQREIVSILTSMESLEAGLEAKLGAELESRREQHEHYRDLLLTFTERRSVRWVTLGEVVMFINGKPHERLVDPDGEIALMTSRFISTQGASARYVRAANVLTPAHKGDVAMVMSDLPNGRALARTFFVDAELRYAANQRVCLLRSSDPGVLAPRFLHYVANRNKQLLGTTAAWIKPT